MDAANAVHRLAEALRDDRLVALIGSGASAEMTDQAGRVYEGLPTPQEFVENVRASHKYISAEADFVLACDEIVAHEGRLMLEELLVRAFNASPAAEIPPAHKILSWLPFAAYVTSNYDEFLERQLQKAFRRISIVIENEDLARISRASIPVVKYHGCVSRPATMVAASDDFDRLYGKTSLVRQLIAINLAKSNLLVIGHGLTDRDIRRLLDELLRDLSDYMPTVYVVREPSRAAEALDLPYRVTLIYEDLTRFLGRLLHEHRAAELTPLPAVPVADEAWLDSAFFAELRQVSVLPTETQVIDAFLNRLVVELVARRDVESVRADARIAIKRVLDDRPNYGALRRTWEALDSLLESKSPDLESCEGVLLDHIDLRRRKDSLFKNVGRQIVERDDRLLIYSQSVRVIQALSGVITTTQGTVDVFIAECRPKSPAPYDDAAAICRELSDTKYTLTVCPDVVAINLLSQRQVTKVLMGTHAIYVDENNVPYAFVNTCGSLALAVACEAYEVPLVVIGEDLKLETVAREEAKDHMFSHQEDDLLALATGIRELADSREVRHINVGYDLVFLGEWATVVVPDSDQGG